ncbi:MAG: preprotein translocase subunit SecG [Candidatus Yanofskybacteria bacterium RIFCSPHIGHO2_01_FULL_42_12]|uniref:Protein-export membrane protein SecG n=1 Tax=Candidatus Yanofskybacteria bacterium RIFCSPLOWO2_01_FULL_42_49 TaxID=1802694 RepID=A0A1F8GF08_9BACT|nr:MAG: preprotein translocase subunit SecG [Candidatus Yanofskybacteria bacterium RIFCSPHIGHO2_01_FULL_42_12]OGN23029.1 MAG: preprotein translocase subunit SecG [Candidatus Yanofskybacteria bacterium RIFCSPLOWO2_01_FULL_42_49]
MNTILTYSQIILALLLTAAVLVQQKGSGLSSAFGGSGAEYSTKRGAEKFFFYATIVLAILFLTLSVLRII